jgi:hypothetical protein
MACALHTAPPPTSSEGKTVTWICDTAEGHHSLSSHPDDFLSINEASGRVGGVVKGATAEVKGKGTIVVDYVDADGRLDRISFDALYVPEAEVDRIVGVADFDLAGGGMVTGQQRCKLITGDGKEWRGVLDSKSGHYLLPGFKAAVSHVAATDSTDSTTLAVTRKPRATEAQAGVRPPMMTKQMLWHLRLGH